MRYFAVAALLLATSTSANAFVLEGAVQSGQGIFFDLPSLITPGQPFNSNYTLAFDVPIDSFEGLTGTRYTIDDSGGVTRSIFQFVTRVDSNRFSLPIAGFFLGQQLTQGKVIAVEPARVSFGPTFSVAPSANYRVFITPVPEPATWAMMLSGFGLAGAAMRRRRVGVRFA